MNQDFDVFYQFSGQSSNNNQNFQFPSTEIMNSEYNKIRFQCNLKLLQKKIIMLFGFPSIKVESQRIHLYLKGILNLSQSEQLKKIRNLISFMGEVTCINNWDERILIIKSRVQQFLNIHGLEIKWGEEQWQNEIDSIVTVRINNYYYDTIQNKTFSYVNLFNTLQIKLPKELKDLNHHSFNSIQTSNLLNDFHFLCDLDEFYTVRNTRNFIQNISNKLSDFMNLLIDMEIKSNQVEQYIRNRYQTLCEQLLDIKRNFTFLISYSDHQKINKKQNLNIDKQQLETQTLTTSKTTIIQGDFYSKTKKQIKKKKLEKHSNQRSSNTYSISKGNIKSELNLKNQCLDQSQVFATADDKDLILQLQNQLQNNNLMGLDFSQIFEYSLERIKQKILYYEYIQYQIDQLGYPCINLEKNKLLLILENYKIQNSDYKNLIVKLFNILSESFISKNGSIDIFQQLQDNALNYLQQISIDFPIQELNSIQKEQCILKSNMSIYGNLRSKKFSYQLLSQIINRKFPDVIYKIQCSSTKIIFQHWDIQPLLDIFNFQDLKNIRVTQYYINQIYTCLQVLINFKESLQNHYDQELVQDFIKIEKQFIDIINQPLNFHVDSNQYTKSLEKLSQFKDIFWNKQYENIQVWEFDMVKDLPKLSTFENEQIYGQLQENQKENLDYQIREVYFDIFSPLYELDSPIFRFINKSEQQFPDQQQNLEDESYSIYFSK
ncbi:unnamed protein product [Paramecium sonneborni]|uniref:Uncharacterized protein n=1 Tax=Paramecium sonneborni TaxID=65129 RepID=A0A8S1K885_9CILI|nr:unnamed protein product [Paramecium sonneborni]